MNKKLVSIVMSAATLLSGVAFADCDPQYYVGGEVQATRLGYGKNASVVKKLKKTWLGGGAFVGSRFNENLGVEAGYTFVGRKTQKALEGLVQRKINIQSAYLDMMGYLPVDCAMDLIGSVGAGYIKTGIKIINLGVIDFTTGRHLTQENTEHDHFVRVRLGVGAQYKFTDNIGTRVMLNYQPTKGKTKHMTSAKVGMFYQF
jgi:opacity protein-like surface antigen